MADPQYQSIPPLKRPLLLLAVAVTVIALALGFAGTDERLLLVPAAVALVWAAAYRAQPEESVRQLRGVSQGVVVVRRTPPIGARQRREMPPTSSEFAPAAALAQARAKAPDAKLVRKYNVGMPDRPESTPEKGETRKKKRKGRGEGEGGKPTLGL
ncbi:MAG: hypothetical protein NWQ93_02730 [bacterium Ellin6529]|jgi:hypothetical protein|uniref:hypothetical protein n=1 Tax=Candidatus Limnocylindrus sp. TaxID=2802978 RepID=UPI002792A322|nr:hypothetical protein [bacterium Ellin6529]